MTFKLLDISNISLFLKHIVILFYYDYVQSSIYI